MGTISESKKQNLAHPRFKTKQNLCKICEKNGLAQEEFLEDAPKLKTEYALN